MTTARVGADIGGTFAHQPVRDDLGRSVPDR